MVRSWSRKGKFKYTLVAATGLPESSWKEGAATVQALAITNLPTDSRLNPSNTYLASDVRTNILNFLGKYPDFRVTNFVAAYSLKTSSHDLRLGIGLGIRHQVQSVLDRVSADATPPVNPCPWVFILK